MSEQFARTEALLGAAAMTRLQSARVAVFGVGGVGGYVVEALVRSGVGTVDVFDKDDVSITNLNRQIIALHSTVGQDKVSVIAARMRDISPDVVIHEHKMFYLPENADQVDLTVYDFVVDAVDTVAAKIELAVRCEAAGIPLIAAMGAGNKLDPSKLLISDIYKTSVCPLARAMRSTLRKRGVKHLTVAWSTEEPLRPAEAIENEGQTLPGSPRKDVPASAAFVPSAMGLLIASHVVRNLTGHA
ncbi:MAG: tRNA threonylcarbamoyladenosine dehydratase [Clostridia bacterium]|nr:tRNA threonylcarbamoyladenosine dehydratase [Clostridia bacterium]